MSRLRRTTSLVVGWALAVGLAAGLPLSAGADQPAAPAGATAPSGQALDPEVHTEEISRQVVDEMRAHRAELHRCYERLLARSRKLSGEVLVQVTRSLTGQGQTARLLTNTTGDDILGACVQQVASGFAVGGVLRPGESVAFPVHFRPPAAQFTLRSEDAPSLGPAGGAVDSRILIDDETMGAGGLAMLHLRIRPGARLAMHRHPDSAELLYVLAGRCRITSLTRTSQMLEPGWAAHFPAGEAHTVQAVEARVGERAPLELLDVFVPPGPERRLRDPNAPAETEVVTLAVAERQGARGRAAAAEANRVATSRSTAGGRERGAAGQVAQCVVCKSMALPSGPGPTAVMLTPGLVVEGRASLSWLRFPPGSVLSTAGAASVGAGNAASRALAARALYLLHGSGRLRVAGEELPLESGMAIHLPLGVPYTIEARESMEALDISLPAVPEPRPSSANSNRDPASRAGSTR